MADTIEALAGLLQGGPLANRPISQLAIDQSHQSAFAIDVDYDHAFEAWRWLRGQHSIPNRYPILTYGWGSNDFFSRFYYREEVEQGTLPDSSPASILSHTDPTDAETRIAAFLAARRFSQIPYLEDAIDYDLEQTQLQFQTAPARAEIEALIEQQVLQSTVDLEQWLFNWELQHCDPATVLMAPDLGYLEWFRPAETIPLLLLPIQNGWDALAYLHWTGTFPAGTPLSIDLLKRWHERYGAELVSHYGTMLELVVSRRPTTPEAAFQLAWEQTALAECTTVLSGVSLRNHARALLAVDRWFIHERP